ncbi:Hypothetical predicted protein [Cloeon dipterum]|uniref:Uncharacterized protein n=1 Tax=Cloeon dipterum TaxID=197152 RepID=A0A8S1CG34_9INSE|nr:Hypothetical predicted protein [Cloeon dipterum]
MGPVSTLGLLLLLVACASCASNENYGINLFKDYLRNGKEYETILNGEIPPKYLCEPSLSALQTEINQIFNLFLRVLRTGSILDFYRASPSLLLPEGGGTKRNQFWRSVGRREVEEDGPLEFPDVARDMAVVRPIAARTFLAKRDVGEGEDQRSKEAPAKKALFSWPAEPPRRPDDLRYTHPPHAL